MQHFKIFVVFNNKKLMKMLKKITNIILLITIIFFASCDGKDIGKPCEISDEARIYYQYDAASLALEYMQQIQSADTFSIDIPDEYNTPFMNALGMIYDSPDIPYYDSIILCKRYIDDTYGATFLFSFDEPWIINWIEDIFPTGNNVADSLITKYNLVLDKSRLPYFLFVLSNKPLNYKSLVDIFEDFSGIEQGFAGTKINYKSKIKGVLDNNLVNLRFYLGNGECNPECSEYNHWDYLISLDNCTIQYLGMNE